MPEHSRSMPWTPCPRTPPFRRRILMGRLAQPRSQLMRPSTLAFVVQPGNASAGTAIPGPPTYVTNDLSQTTSEAVQPFPVAAYDYFDRLRLDTNYSRFADALRDLAALEQLTGTTFDPLVLALQNGDLAAATAYEQYDMAGLRFKNLCDVSDATAVRLHIFRVGSDGFSFDMVIREWNYTESTVYAATPGDPYDFTRVQSAPQPWNVGGLPMIITNADTGALVSWKVEYLHYCPLETDAGCASDVTTNTEYHLTTTAGSSVALDVIWDNPGPDPVRPLLQLQDGSFVGAGSPGVGSDSMVAFDSSGNIKWIVPDYYPTMATADGGVIGLSGPYDYSTRTSTSYTFDANSNATGRLGNLPMSSWKGSYSLAVGSSVQSVAALFPDILPSYAAVSPVSLGNLTLGGNLTGNGTAVVHTTIGLFWCNEIWSGTCAGIGDGYGHGLLDLGFYY